MRNICIFLLMAFSQFATAQTQLDPKMFGSWNGSEKNQQKVGLEKHWIQHRFPDGTFILLFTIIEDGEVSTFAEKGKWWTENGEFHEFHNNSGLTDIYTYKFIDDDHVRLKSKLLSLNFDNAEYEFTDTKIREDDL
jgi:hypothetical protein